MGKYRIELMRTERIYVDVMAPDAADAQALVERWLYDDDTAYDMLSNTDHVSGPSITAIVEDTDQPYPLEQDIPVADGIFVPKFIS